jgi:hypothetical protein
MSDDAGLADSTRDSRRTRKGLRYYDIRRHWTKRIEPHLGDEALNTILVCDFNKFTYGRWREWFKRGDYPFDFESCDWWLIRRRPHPPFWRYVKDSACHWLVNFNLRLAQLAERGRPWRILTSDDHSTVWDGDRTLFDLIFLAQRVPPEECFRRANVMELPVGRRLKVYLAEHHLEESAREERERERASDSCADR